MCPRWLLQAADPTRLLAAGRRLDAERLLALALGSVVSEVAGTGTVGVQVPGPISTLPIDVMVRVAQSYPAATEARRQRTAVERRLELVERWQAQERAQGQGQGRTGGRAPHTTTPQVMAARSALSAELLVALQWIEESLPFDSELANFRSDAGGQQQQLHQQRHQPDAEAFFMHLTAAGARPHTAQEPQPQAPDNIG